jgi:hypothetical protein
MGRLLNEKTTLSVPFVGPAERGEVSTKLISDPELSTWGEATEQFVSKIEGYEQAEADTGTTLHPAFDPHIYTEAWADAVWSHLYNYDEHAVEWAESTALLTFSASYWLDKDSQTFCPPLTFLTYLQESKQARQRALSRALNSVDHWASLRAIGGSGHNGYPRVFLGLYLSEVVEPAVFEPVLNAHVRNCPLAEVGPHTVENGVQMRTEVDVEPPVELVNGIGKQVPALSEGGIINETEDRQRMAAALHALNLDPYSTAQSR